MKDEQHTPIVERLRNFAREWPSATRSDVIYEIANRSGRFEIREADLSEAADIITDLLEALESLVEKHIKRGPFDEPLGESEQSPEINAARAALSRARNGGNNA